MEHPEALAASFSATHHLDLFHVLNEWDDVKRLWFYVLALPFDSLVFRRAWGARREWSEEKHLLAYVIDGLRGISWQLGGDAQAPRPDPFPRPEDDVEDVPEDFDPHQLAAFLGAAPVYVPIEEGGDDE